MKTKFKYGDKVKITDGFWAGNEGVIDDCGYDIILPDVVDNIEYNVLIFLDHNVLRNTMIKESWLRKVK